MRFSRHVMLPEIGEVGQARLEAATVAAPGEPRAAAVAREYLERAGVTVRHEPSAPSATTVEPGRPELAEAAAFIAGALYAVEAIKATVEAGEAASLHVSLTGPEEAR